MKKNIILTYVLTSFALGLFLMFTGCVDNDELAVYEYPEQTVGDFSPTSGRPGTEITINGADFGTFKKAVTVFFNGFAATQDQIISVTNDKIVVEVPEEVSTGKISVKVWTYTKETESDFLFIPGAKVASIDAGSRVKAGDVITVTGENFGTDANAIHILIGDVEAEVTSVTDTEIKFVVPDTGSGILSLNAGGQEVEIVYLLIGDEKITGTLIGHTGSWGNNPATFIAAAIDGDIDTFVDGANKIGYVGYDVGSDKVATLTSIRYVPRESHPQRMVGGEIRGANDLSLFDAVTLYTITEEPPIKVYTDVSISTAENYRYIYYYSPDGNGNIAEIEFYGNIIDAVIPVGKHVFEFDDPNAANYWIGVNGSTPTNVIEDGKLKVTFNASQFEGTNKRRADLKYIEGGTFPEDSPTGKWQYSSEYPILAFKISFTGTGAVGPNAGNIKLDRFDNKNNSYLTDYVSDNVIYYDVSTVITDSQDLASWQLKIADITSTEETGYEVDWIRTFKTVAELEAFLQN